VPPPSFKSEAARPACAGQSRVLHYLDTTLFLAVLLQEGIVNTVWNIPIQTLANSLDTGIFVPRLAAFYCRLYRGFHLDKNIEGTKMWDNQNFAFQKSAQASR